MQKKGRAGQQSRAGKIALYGMNDSAGISAELCRDPDTAQPGRSGDQAGIGESGVDRELYLLGAGAAAAIALVRIVLVGFTFGTCR